MVRRILESALIGLCAALLAIAAWKAGGLEAWIENPSWNLRARLLAHPGTATDRIRLIFLDEKTLDWAAREHSLTWPWPRDSYASIFDFCKRGPAKAVLFDTVFPDRSAFPEQDRALGQILARSGPVVCVTQFGNETARTAVQTNWPPSLILPTLPMSDLRNIPPNWMMSSAVFPIPDVATNCALLAHAGTGSTLDEVIRRLPPVVVFDRHAIPAAGLALFLAGTNQVSVASANGRLHVGDRRIPLDQSGNALLRFRGPSQTHRAVSAAAVIQSEINLQNNLKPTLSPDYFKDKYVLFGATAQGLFDLRYAPVSRGRVYPGVEFHATFLDNLLSDDFIRPAPLGLDIGLTVLLAVLGAVLTRLAQRGWQAATLFAILLPIPLLAGIAAYAAGIALSVAPMQVGTALGLIGGTISAYAVEGRQKRFIKSAFRHYLSPVVIDQMLAHPETLRLGGETRELSFFFSDIKGFTGISETLTPEHLTSLLNEYLTAMSNVIMSEGGTVDKYVGDAIVAFWNAPTDQADHARRAVRAALHCQDRLSELRPDFARRYGHNLHARIGLNTGLAVVGNMGSNHRFNYTFLGDAGSLASRLEGLNKQFGIYVLMSEFTFRVLPPDEFRVREVSKVRVVGRNEPVRIYEPMTPAFFAQREAVLKRFAEALQSYYAGDFRHAAEAFAAIADADAPARMYTTRCRQLIERPPSSWDGVWTMTEK